MRKSAITIQLHQEAGLVALTDNIIRELCQNSGYDRDHPIIKNLYTIRTSLVGMGCQINGFG